MVTTTAQKWQVHNSLQAAGRHLFDVQKCLMITVHDKYDGRQDFVHALAIAHQRIDARIAEQNVGHDLLDVGAPEKFDARNGADHILSDDRAQFLITKVLIPDAAVRL